MPGAGANKVTSNLLTWYDRHARTLPWRTAPDQRRAGVWPDAYRVWLSEVMLQQTTVAAVKKYFEDFTTRWPKVHDLAAARDEEVMAAWAGLGYYARARNLLACARAVSATGGAFPASAARLRDLPGIGDYTSAAIAAIAYDEPVAVVDGNIERVISRLFCIDRPLPAARAEIRQKMQALTPQTRAGDFAQAMMDLGATICTPRRPVCALCPVNDHCGAYSAGTAEDFPVKKKKPAKPERVGAAFVAERPSDGAVFLRQRPPSGMLGGMAEPPTTAWSARQDGATGDEAAPFEASWREAGKVRHTFTHFHLTLTVWHARANTNQTLDGWWQAQPTLDQQALPTLMRKCLALALAKP
ncbi:A/G-specific adenine glycosylase [Aureimonas fodinaquatilis]|uniref:Adenine DNA glycosylase n=1 Tax=Aureimonas fodinaquatilis TaxID=2565783 RepID=A0A5B0E4Y8_9HYPH|nr:A/G-specific adenine glycosylase [Aureimonas fodinaquatilis]KAA0972499.1 A/G-specific adenine glycosylase [Aureimonas fodinaquatilis]